MTEPVRVVVLHGSYGTPDANWFPWLAGEVAARGHRAVVPRLPTPEGQALDNWQRAFTEQVGALDRNTILVGHSVSVAFILHLLETATSPVMASLLASGFIGLLGNHQFDPIVSTFVDRPFDWARIRAHAGVARVYHGDNDPYVPVDRGVQIADLLGASLTIIPEGGHLDEAAGFTEFPVLLDDLAAIVAG